MLNLNLPLIFFASAIFALSKLFPLYRIFLILFTLLLRRSLRPTKSQWKYEFAKLPIFLCKHAHNYRRPNTTPIFLVHKQSHRTRQNRCRGSQRPLCRHASFFTTTTIITTTTTLHTSIISYYSSAILAERRPSNIGNGAGGEHAPEDRHFRCACSQSERISHSFHWMVNSEVWSTHYQVTLSDPLQLVFSSQLVSSLCAYAPTSIAFILCYSWTAVGECVCRACPQIVQYLVSDLWTWKGWILRTTSLDWNPSKGPTDPLLRSRYTFGSKYTSPPHTERQ